MFLLRQLVVCCGSVVSFNKRGGYQKEWEKVVEHKAARSKPLSKAL